MTTAQFLNLERDQNIQLVIIEYHNTGELVGYVDLGSVGNQLCELERVLKRKTRCSSDGVAKFVLVLMVRGVTSDLKFPFAAFSTAGVTADFLYPIVWKAISILEVTVKVKVLFCTCDGASANRRFFKLHAREGDNFIHKTINPHDTTREIFFISDVPHLLKTARNCFSNSYSHSKSRTLWNAGKDISWMHIVKLFEEHCDQNHYTPCPKLTRGHIDLNAFSKMKVRLAAQVLSETVANSLEMLFDDSVSETVTFIRMMNKFFDCLNVRSPYEGRNKRNPNLDAYTRPDDDRLEWLTKDFLQYFEDWKRTIEERGDFTDAEKASMQLSHQTLLGLKISAHSITACVKFMLQKGSQYILVVLGVYIGGSTECTFSQGQRSRVNAFPTCVGRARILHVFYAGNCSFLNYYSDHIPLSVVCTLFLSCFLNLFS
ncbi:uncharacterized protein LOC111100775 [Crassostrea virginica]